MLCEDRAGERLDHPREGLGGSLARLPHGLARPALGEPGGLPGQHHRRERLPDGVEDAVDEPLSGTARDVNPAVCSAAEEHLAGCAGQQRPVEVEERGPCHAGSVGQVLTHTDVGPRKPMIGMK